jgi:transcriptional regulator with XRE-family HTH domain
MNQYLIDLLKRLSEKLDGANDSQIAKRLNVSRRTVAEWRMGTSRMEGTMATLIAEILGRDPDLLELEVAVACAPDDRSREAYSRLLEQKRCLPKN